MVNQVEIIKEEMEEIFSLEKPSLLEMAVEEDFKYDFSQMWRTEQSKLSAQTSKENLEICNILDFSKVKEENPKKCTVYKIKEIKIILERINIKDLVANGVKKFQTKFSEKDRTLSSNYFSNSQEGSMREIKESEEAANDDKRPRKNYCESPVESPKRLKVFRAKYRSRKRRIGRLEKKFKCPVCQKNICNQYYLKSHMMMHSSERPFKCDTCGKGYWLKSILERHVVKHFEDEKKIKCNLCPKLFLQPENLTNHMKTHANAKEYKCPHCEKCFNLKGILAIHIRAKHTRNTLHECNICNKSFAHKRYLEVHKRIHSHEQLFVCPICDKRFSSEYNAKRHRNTHEPKYTCNECNEKFANKIALMRHMLIHFPTKPLVCDKCEYKTTKRYRMVVHYRIHTKKKLFICDYCSQRFVTINDLRDHIYLHTDEYPFRCDKCNKGFDRSRKLREHRKVHAISKNTRIIKPSFEHSYAKKMNIVIHLSSELKECPMCGLGFKDDILMQDHLTEHYGMEKPFMCTICCRNFKYQEFLEHCQKTVDLLGRCPNE